jgi:hypothetical protein
MPEEKNTQLVQAPREAIESTEALPETSEAKSTNPNAEPIEEIRTDTPASPKASQTQKEAPNPLLTDPYEFNRCTITIVYTLLANQGNVSVSVHSHKDAPIVKTFPEAEVPLPERVSRVIGTLQEIWPGSEVSATFALLPQTEGADRMVTVSIRANRDTPLVHSCLESELPLPAPILAMLEELKVLLPGRAMESIQKAAKSAKKIKRKPTIVTSPTKPVKTEPLPTPTPISSSTQMNMF